MDFYLYPCNLQASQYIIQKLVETYVQCNNHAQIVAAERKAWKANTSMAAKPVL